MKPFIIFAVAYQCIHAALLPENCYVSDCKSRINLSASLFPAMTDELQAV